MTLDGYEVLTTRPDFAQNPEIAAARFSVKAALGQSRRITGFPGQMPVHTLSHRYVLRGSGITDYEAFFNARCGRWQQFLLPSWCSELGNGATNVTTSPNGAANLWVDWCDYANNFGPADGRLGRYVFILWPDGTFFTAKVNSVAATSPNVFDKLALSANLPKDATPDDGQMIGFIYLARFGADELELTYSGPSNAAAEMTYVEHVISTPEADVA